MGNGWNDSFLLFDLVDMKSEHVPSGLRRALWTTAGLLGTQLVGSLFNIWYNITQIRPLLTEAQDALFGKTIGIYNLTIYPISIAIWAWLLRSLLQANQSTAAAIRARRRAINLPWWAVAILVPAWLLTIPALLISLHNGPGEIDPQISVHLTISVIIGALMALTHGFFIVEILSQKLWFPVLFHDTLPIQTPGTVPITISRRGLLWAISAVVGPIVSLLLIILGPEVGELNRATFALSVGAVGILFGFSGAWMLGRIIIEPIEELREAASDVAGGDLSAHVDLLRADEFGLLIEQVNDAVSELREKERAEAIFGRSVGFEVAKVLLERGGEELAGVERTITVVFTDIRNFTPRCAAGKPREVVRMLNIFFNHMVDTVEGHNGIVNQFTGDGFMAMFGATETSTTHADDALACGRKMLEDLKAVNQVLIANQLDPIEIGIGINTGSAVVGAIGTDRRSCYTAVGDTVNVSARIESHTKVAGQLLLFSETTRLALSEQPEATTEAPPAALKGKDEPMKLYYLAEA